MIAGLTNLVEHFTERRDPDRERRNGCRCGIEAEQLQEWTAQIFSDRIVQREIQPAARGRRTSAEQRVEKIRRRIRRDRTFLEMRENRIDAFAISRRRRRFAERVDRSAAQSKDDRAREVLGAARDRERMLERQRYRFQAKGQRHVVKTLTEGGIMSASHVLRVLA